MPKNDQVNVRQGLRSLGLGKFITFAVIGGTLSYFSFAAAIASITSSKNPVLALKFDPSHPVALVSQADALASAEPDDGGLATMERFARASLLKQPLNARALRLLATSMRPNQPEARRVALLNAAEKFSRREIGTQMLLIEINSQTDDIGATLRHYDIALRTNRPVRNALFPILASAIEDPAINREFSKYIGTSDLWLADFIQYQLTADNKSDALVDAFISAPTSLIHRIATAPNFRSIKQYVFERAVMRGRVADARAIYAKYAIGDLSYLISPAFDDQQVASDNSVVRWRLTTSAAVMIQSNRSRSTGTYELVGAISPGANGALASKLLILPAGRMSIIIQYGELNLNDGVQLRWTMNCVGDNAEETIFRSDSGNTHKQKSVRIDFEIPADCKAQNLNLELLGLANSEYSDILVRSIAMVPN